MNGPLFLPQPDDPPYIVCEVCKNWPNQDVTPVSKLFERIINVNHHRGYSLKGDWKFYTRPQQVMLPDGTTTVGMTETIIAVFERRPISDLYG